MLTGDENERLTRVGPGTPMGDMLRRYWMPIAVSVDVTDKPVKRRLLGEDLVVFRAGNGQVGIVQERCSHRRTSLTVGISEEDGIRCGYHGWKFALDGRILEQPAEPRLNTRASITAYPAQELGGLVFAYLGPQPAPLLPAYDLFVMDNCMRDIGHATLGFNWLQAMENAVDPYHGEWLHGHYMNAVRAREGHAPVKHYAKKHIKVGFDAFDYGIIKRRLLEGGDESEDGWAIGHPLVFPNMVKIGGAGFQQLQIRVPLDDEHYWHIWYTVYTPPVTQLPKQDFVPAYEVPVFDAQGEYIVSYIDGQDLAAWGGQGVIADRTKETLGASDVGIVMYRRMLQEQLQKVADGQDPLCVIRDPAKNRYIQLDVEKTKPFSDNRTYISGILNAQAVLYSPINDQLKDLFGVSEPA